MNYQRIYDNLINRAKNRNLIGYAEKHHIVPKSIGGNDNSSNLVELSAREHFICHLLLFKIYRSHGLLTAIWMMSNKRKYSSRKYEELKSKFSKIHSEFMTGKSFATEESKKKAIETKRKKGTLNLSENTKKKISDATKGRYPTTTDQSRRKNSIDSSGRKWVNNGIDSCMAKGEKLDELLASGWVLGRLLTPTLIEGVKKGGKATGGFNKGMPMSEEQKEKCKHTFFKKGQIPHNKKK